MDRVCRALLIAAVLGGAYALAALAVKSPGLAVLAGLVLAAAVARRGNAGGSDVYGDARFCSEDDARNGGLL